MRMKLEVPFYDDMSPARMSPAQTPDTALSRAMPFGGAQRRSMGSSPGRAFSESSSPAGFRSSGDIGTVEDATKQLRNYMRNSLGSQDPVIPQYEVSHEPERIEMPPAEIKPPPAPPLLDPWDVKAILPRDEIMPLDDAAIERRPQVPRGDSESPVDPSISPSVIRDPRQSFTNQLNPHTSQLSHSSGGSHGVGINGFDPTVQMENDRAHLPSSISTSPGRGDSYHGVSPLSHRPRNPTITSNVSSTIPEDIAIDGTGGVSIRHAPSQGTMPPALSSSWGQASDSGFAGFDSRRPEFFQHHTHYSNADTISSSQLSPTARPVDPVAEGLELAPATFSVDHDLPIPVESENQPHEDHPVIQPSSADCSITPGSSFWLSKGFCEGAKEVCRGGIGVEKRKKPVSLPLQSCLRIHSAETNIRKVGFTTSSTVAKCTNCVCELDFKDIESDVNKLGMCPCELV